MAEFLYLESASSQMEQEPRVLRAQFGDGYEQRAPDGLNPIPEVWNVKFRGCADAGADVIIAFFRTHGGVLTFDWRPRGTTSPRKFICPSWRRSLGEEADTSDIDAVFELRIEP